ncbi:hypothetical protein MMC27_001163 [Xylographa pallens]|nr:hypothetical protein [Xylographa pallens]
MSFRLSSAIPSTLPISLALGTLGTLSLLYIYTRPSTTPATSHSSPSQLQNPPNSIPSPVDTLLPHLSPAEQSALPYPPDIFPGARDVESPYGSLRVYEWGPEEGRKVLLVHGISTPCLSLGGIAEGLAECGARVMLIAFFNPIVLQLSHFTINPSHPLNSTLTPPPTDLWGRGYSATPLLPHDPRLYTSALLIALASSPLSWTGASTSFSLIGYSLGGGICANFTSYFPALVSSLILIAPAGLIRAHRFSALNRLTYALPDWVLEPVVKRRLKSGPAGATAVKPKRAEGGPEGEVVEEGGAFDGAVLSTSRPGVTVKDAVAWQVSAHHGFPKSFISSVRHGPISGQHAVWRRIGTRLSAQNAATEHATDAEQAAQMGLQEGKVLVICGKSDPVIDYRELVEDAMEVLQGHVRFETCAAGHEVPITRSKEVVEYIWDFWGGRQGRS